MPENPEPAADKKEFHRVIAYVDGYNLYYAVNVWAKHKENPNLIKYDLWKLVRYCLKKINKKDEANNLAGIKFYTAPPRAYKSMRGKLNVYHYKQWIKRQKRLNVDVIEGVHRKKDDSYVEKQSDVNLAVDMLWGGAIKKPVKKRYNTAVLISNDTDYCRLVLKCLKLKKHVLVLGTEKSIWKELFEGKLHSAECKKYRDGGTLDFYQINEDDIENCLDWKYIKQTSDNE